MKHRLPLIVEQSVQSARASRVALTNEFNSSLGRISCEKGCHHCCYHPVMISLFEGITLFRWLSDNLMWTTTLKAKFEKAHKQTYDQTIKVWLLAQIPCPLLTDAGECSAYEGRPFQCRVTVSTGDSYYCHPHRITEASIVPRAEWVAKAAKGETSSRKRHRVGSHRFPLAAAVLYAERICTQDLDFEDAAVTIWRDLRER